MTARLTVSEGTDRLAAVVTTARRLPLLDAAEAAPSSPQRSVRARAPMERCDASDRFHDYVLKPYEPVAPAERKLRSLNFLVESFALVGVEDEGRRVVDRVREALGPFRTVWGVKRLQPGADDLAWEVYFYDPERTHADLSIARLRDALGAVLRIEATETNPLPWHMFSVQFDARALRGEAEATLHVYVDMRSYELRGTELVFENIYTFHDARTEVDEVLHRLRSSVHVNARRENLARIVPPTLFRCARICVANKRLSDAVYFSRVGTSALLDWLGRDRWPDALARFAAVNAHDLDHLLWDVGIDFRAGPSGVEVGKSGIYGSF